MVVMRDKLFKTGHKRPYYVMKKIMVGMMFSFLAIALVAIPTYIVYTSNQYNSELKATEEEETNTEDTLTYEEEVVE